MNPLIQNYFEDIEVQLIVSPIVIAYQVLSSNISSDAGKIRIELKLLENDTLEIFEYVMVVKGKLRSLKYNYEWLDNLGNLKVRWDNNLHQHEFTNSLHHVHYEGNRVEENDYCSSIEDILQEISDTYIHHN